MKRIKSLLSQYNIQQLAVGLLLFLVILIPRVISLETGWSYDEDHWVRSSWQFLDAVSEGKWERTYLSYHPGVLTTWGGAIGLWIYGFAEGLPQPYTVDTLKATRVPIALMVSIGLILAYFLLTKIYRRSLAVLAILFIAINPFYLAHSRLAHTDALLTTFILLSILSMVIYLKACDKKYLFLSGIFAGIGLLTKTNALLIYPYAIIVLSLFSCTTLGKGNSEEYRGQNIGIHRKIVGWLSASMLPIFLIWPASWGFSVHIKNMSIPVIIFIGPALAFGVWYAFRDKPMYLLESFFRKMVNWKSITVFVLLVIVACSLAGVPQDLLFIYKLARSGLTHYEIVDQIQTNSPWLHKIATSSGLITALAEAAFVPHMKTHLFFGKVDGDPGIFFYPGTILLRTTPIILILLGISVIFAMFYFRNRKHPSMPTVIVLSFVIFYVIGLTFVAKKLDRFLLPVYPCLDIIAAVTLWHLKKKIGTFIASPRRYVNGVIWSMVALTVIAQSFLTLKLHPYYLAYYSPVFGKGPEMIHRIYFGRCEGLDKAAAYLNQKENAEDLTAAVPSFNWVYFQPYFRGMAVPHNQAQLADYVILYLHDITLRQDTDVVEQYYRRMEPEHIVEINGIPYAWVYQRHFDFTYQPVEVSQRPALKLEISLRENSDVQTDLNAAGIAVEATENWEVVPITTPQGEDRIFHLIPKQLQVPSEFEVTTSGRFANGDYVLENQVVRFYQCATAPEAIRMDGDLSEWQDISPITLNSPDFLVNHVDWWRGKDDLSVKTYAACGKKDLYLAIDVLDNVASELDSVMLFFASKFKDGFRPFNIYLKPDIHETHGIQYSAQGISDEGFKVFLERSSSGYSIELGLPISDLREALGTDTGCYFSFSVRDVENRNPKIVGLEMTWFTRGANGSKDDGVCLLGFPDLSITE